MIKARTTILVSLGALFVSSFASVVPAATPDTTPTSVASRGATIEGQLKVVSIDKARRSLTLEDPSGHVAKVRATDAVRNFDQIQVGDTVKIAYNVEVIAKVRGHNVPAIPGVIVQGENRRAAKGLKPMGQDKITAMRSVTIVSVDKATHTVTFREPDGSVDSLVVQDPKNYAFLNELKPGVVVDVTKTESLAISVEKM
jgi:hypothetical protein